MIDPVVLSSRGQRRCTEPLVLLHGWGCDSRSWQPLLERLNRDFDIILCALPGFSSTQELSADIESYLASLLDVLPKRFYIAGWSLGGMLATRLATQAPSRIQGLITLATNLCFVERSQWLDAMGCDQFSEFLRGFEQSPEITLKRFAGLMSMGDSDERGLLKSLRADCMGAWKEAADYDSATSAKQSWLQGLQWLEQLDNRITFSQLAVSGLHLFADGDALVPVAVAGVLSEINASQKTEVISSASHAIHWSQTSKVFESMSRFIEETHYVVDKSKVADSFGRAADRYDSVAGLQRDIGHQLLKGLKPSAKSMDDRWLDLGCGTGYFTPEIREHLSLVNENLFGLDLSEGMLAFARENRGDQFSWLCGDAENLPIGDRSLDGVFSSLAIQWCADLPKLFQELSRVIVRGGEIHLATLGPRTLTELRQSWSQVDDYTHVNRFAEESTIRSAIDGSDLSLLSWHSEDIVLQYDQVRELTYELKTLGAHNMNHGQSSGLTGRQRITQFKQAYESFRQSNGKLPATYEVFYIRLGLT